MRARQDSNLRLLPPEGNALSTELRAQLTGAGERSRTPDLLITNQLLYQLSYTGIKTTTLTNFSIMETTGRDRIEPPIEPVGQSAFSIVCPNASCLRNSNRPAPPNPLLPVVREINWCKHDATTPSGCAAECRGSAIAVVYLY